MASDRGVEERKKRTLDALERRLAQEKAGHLFQQRKSKKRLHEEKDKMAHHITYPSVDAATAPSMNLSFKKGNIMFSGYMNKEAYFQLTHSIHENLVRDEAEISKKLSVVDKLLHDLFQRGDSAEEYMQGSRSIKIDNWILLDNFVPKNGMSVRARSHALQTLSRRSKRHMSLKQYKSVAHLICQKSSTSEDFYLNYRNGKVVQCKLSAFYGVQGILIRETAETFGIITEDNKFRVVPKKLSVFMLQADWWKITLLGDKLVSRSFVP